MLIAFRLLIVLIAAIPALAIAKDALAPLGVALTVAVLAALCATNAPQGDLSIVTPLLRRMSIAIAFPFLWMVLQIAPLPFTALVNPIWSTAALAMGEPSKWGHVSVDPGATLRSLVGYLALVTLMISTTVIARDRKRAKTIFFVVTAVTTIMSAEVLISQSKTFAGMIPPAGSVAADLFVAMSLLAILCNSALVIMAIERHLSRHDTEDSSTALLLMPLALALLGIAISVTATGLLAQGFAVAALILGLLTLLFVAAFRRLGVRSWPSTIVFLIFATITVASIVPRLQSNPSGRIAGFAASSNAEALALTSRILADTSWLGNGAGTFRALTSVYGDFGGAQPAPPTTALLVAIEWGLPALGILAALALHLFIFLFRGAVRRGRDSFFASAAAASVLVLVAQAFCDTSLLRSVVQVIAAIVVGLGLSQSVGRTTALK